MNLETPQIANFSNTSNTYSLGSPVGLGVNLASNQMFFDPFNRRVDTKDYLSAAKADGHYTIPYDFVSNFKEKLKVSQPTARVVQVFIVDQDKNVPLDKRLLHKTEQIFTDMNDQDLFFDLDIKSILAKHNEERVTFVDKKKSSATEKVFLEPVRVSDLKMVVSVIAEF